MMGACNARMANTTAPEGVRAVTRESVGMAHWYTDSAVGSPSSGVRSPPLRPESARRAVVPGAGRAPPPPPARTPRRNGPSPLQEWEHDAQRLLQPSLTRGRGWHAMPSWANSWGIAPLPNPSTIRPCETRSISAARAGMPEFQWAGHPTKGPRRMVRVAFPNTPRWSGIHRESKPSPSTAWAKSRWRPSLAGANSIPKRMSSMPVATQG
jgi:hypothetical protein